jgi:predicted dehydrogenase
LIDRRIAVLVEKPLSLDLQGLPDLESAARNNAVTAGVAYPFRAHPSVAAMRTAILGGRFGAPLQVTVVAGQHFPTYRPAYREIYYRQRATGGGAIQDALTHMINAVEWIIGPTTSVVADADRLKLDGVEVEDTAHVLARNGNVLVTYSLNQHQPANELSLTVICEHGQARFEGHRARWSWLTEVDGSWQEEPTTLDRDTLFRYQAAEFIDAVENHSRPLCTLAEGRATVQTVLAILRSLESKRWESTSIGN